MSLFVLSLGVGLGGLVLMALPAARRHGRHARVHHARAAGARHGRAHPATAQHGHTSLTDSVLHHVPEPRLVFSVMALFGAAGNLLERAGHTSFWLAAAGAAAIAALLEWAVVGRLWRFALAFGGEPASPLEALVTDRAEAVTVFRNGRGIVRVVRDGRAVQLGAELVDEERHVPVRVGDALVIDEVDAEHERVRVLTDPLRPLPRR